jgi:hypothetical protein
VWRIVKSTPVKVTNILLNNENSSFQSLPIKKKKYPVNAFVLFLANLISTDFYFFLGSNLKRPKSVKRVAQIAP